MHFEINVVTNGKGLYEITNQITNKLNAANIDQGLCVVYIKHTSASLIIQENADDSAKTDLENWLERLVPEDDPIYTHTTEGSDDMPAHIKSILTQTSLTIPIVDRQLVLGTWQGIYLWEHRTNKLTRSIILKFMRG